MTDTHRIAVVGFGYIGCTIGAVLAERGLDVVGIDTNTALVDTVNRGQSPFNEPGLGEMISRGVAAGRLTATMDMAKVAEASVILLTVGTPLDDDGTPQLGHITQACERMAPYVRDGQLVVVKSTVPPYVTHDVVAVTLRKRAAVLVAFSPERLAEGNAINELLSIPIVVGGVDAASTEMAARFWQTHLGVEVIPVADDRTAEMVKLADNLWIDLNIALANELAMLCDKIGVDALEVIRAANSLPKGERHVNILFPSLGVGGYCLTKDPWFVYRFGQDRGLNLATPRTSRTVNDTMPAYSVSLIEDILRRDGTDPSDIRIAVLGMAFKNNTGDCRFTPTKPAISLLVEKGYQVVVHDPWVSREDAQAITGAPVEEDVEAAIKGAHCVAYFTGHKDFWNLPMARVAALAQPNALIFDGRMFFSRQHIAEMHSLGLRYKGVGR